MILDVLIWDVHTGQVHQARSEALYEFVKTLGGWI